MSAPGASDNYHPVERLFAKMESVAPYPAGVVEVPDRIRGTAFFPGGAGLWQTGMQLPPMPVGGLMVLGHNFDSLAGFKRSLAHAGENLRGPTWRNLLQLLDEVGISPERCFFTNVYMGLIDGPSAVGRFPGASEAAFVERCLRFLGEQITVVQPALILTLGNEVIPLLARLTPDLLPWREHPTLVALDAVDSGLLHPVHFSRADHPVAVVALTHPAMRHLNVGRRTYRTFHGHEAEKTLIRDALALTRAIEVEKAYVPA